MQINRGIMGLAVVAAFVRAPRGPVDCRLLELFLLLRGKVEVKRKGTPRLQSRGSLFFFFLDALPAGQAKSQARMLCLACSGRLPGGGDF